MSVKTENKHIDFDLQKIISLFSQNQESKNQWSWGETGGHSLPIWIHVLKRSVLIQVSRNVFRVSSFWISRFHENTIQSRNLRSLLNWRSLAILQTILKTVWLVWNDPFDKAFMNNILYFTPKHLTRTEKKSHETDSSNIVLVWNIY